MSRQLTTAALAAKEIRKELKVAFPTIKFSIRSSNFTGGDSVDIDWIDGPTSKEVQEITTKYQEGHFDGMQDIYEYSNCRTDIHQVKYVMTHRSMSQETKATIIKEIKETWDGMENFNENEYCENVQCHGSAFIYRFFVDKKLA